MLKKLLVAALILLGLGVAGIAGTSSVAPPNLPSDAWMKYIAQLLEEMGNRGRTTVVSITRTADTNVYAANDVIGAATGSTAAVEFTSMGTSAGNVLITGAQIEIDASAIISGETSYNLYCYGVTPPSALGDNVAFDIPSGDRASLLVKIPLGVPVDEGSTLLISTNGINQQVKLAGTSLFCYLVTVGGYTPTSARVYVVTLHTADL